MACNPYDQYMGTCPTWWDVNGPTVIWVTVAIFATLAIVWAIRKNGKSSAPPSVTVTVNPAMGEEPKAK